VFSGTSDNRIQRCPKCLREFNLRCALKGGILPMPCARQPEFRDGCPSSRRSWVRSPPPLPIQPIESGLVNRPPFPVYLWRTLRLHEGDRIVLPSALQISFELLLTRAHPRRIVSLGDSDALMTQEDRYPFERDSREE